jgi:hypothetical protein
LLFTQRKWERNARNEEEERENGVVVSKAIPLDVVHLGGEPRSPLRRGEEATDGHNKTRTTDDEEHIEAPQRIERQQSLGVTFATISTHKLYLYG